MAAYPGQIRQGGPLYRRYTVNGKKLGTVTAVAMVTGLLTSALLVIWIYIVYAWLLERRAGGLPYEVVVSRSILVAVIVVVIELVLVMMSSSGSSFSLLQHTASAGFVVHLAVFTAGYLAVQRVSLQPAIIITAAGLDWLVGRQQFLRAYRRRRAGHVLRGILADRGLHSYR